MYLIVQINRVGGVKLLTLKTKTTCLRSIQVSNSKANFIKCLWHAKEK